MTTIPSSCDECHFAFCFHDDQKNLSQIQTSSCNRIQVCCERGIHLKEDVIKLFKCNRNKCFNERICMWILTKLMSLLTEICWHSGKNSMVLWGQQKIVIYLFHFWLLTATTVVKIWGRRRPKTNYFPLSDFLRCC